MSTKLCSNCESLVNKMKILILLCVFVVCTGVVSADEKDYNVTTENTTESPTAGMNLAGNALKTENQKTGQVAIKEFPGNSQPHTIGDFIIHPLIALKPRVPEAENLKQADGSSTTASPWQLFGFNPAQGLGASVSSLAGTVTGWLGNRIQFPGLMETPVREPPATPAATTTVQPEVVVKIQQRPIARRPLNSINRPNRFSGANYVVDSGEGDYSNEYNDYENWAVKRINHRRYQDYEEDDVDEQNFSFGHNSNGEEVEENEEDYAPDTDDEEEEDELAASLVNPQRYPKRRLKPITVNKRRNSYILRSQFNRNQQRPQALPEDESAEEDHYEDEDQDTYFVTNHESKRSKSELNFIQRGQQNLLKQIRQFTKAQAAAEEANTLNQAQKPKKRPQAGTLVIQRNGQTFYLAPEILQIPKINSNKVGGATDKVLSSRYPPWPLTMPLKRQGQPAQYITIPWSQLGMSSPNQLASLKDGVQIKPLFLTISQDSIEKMQNFGKQRKNPNLASDTVPLLAEASVMDVFKPPRIPSARIPATKPTTTIATRPKLGAARIRPATIVEKAPLVREIKNDNDANNAAETLADDDNAMQYLVIADDAANTKLSRSTYKQIIDYFNQNRSGRQLHDQEAAIPTIVAATTEFPIAMEIPVIESDLADGNNTELVEPKI